MSIEHSGFGHFASVLISLFVHHFIHNPLPLQRSFSELLSPLIDLIEHLSSIGCCEVVEQLVDFIILDPCLSLSIKIVIFQVGVNNLLRHLELLRFSHYFGLYFLVFLALSQIVLDFMFSFLE